MNSEAISIATHSAMAPTALPVWRGEETNEEDEGVMVFAPKNAGRSNANPSGARMKHWCISTEVLATDGST
ncbi:hypothetical protein SB461_25620 [Burkholderia cenocepacia]|uniref:hypothetical protein n=1 Tax=Burkholderia cenocepacia TaxID=95486 RepID=UPI002B23FA5C|nr:hypothetical protein [Burkholderia cenocepacia]MEB2609878.1 hypothetical protein [Burkholderia cenocepacia]